MLLIPPISLAYIPTYLRYVSYVGLLLLLISLNEAWLISLVSRHGESQGFFPDLMLSTFLPFDSIMLIVIPPAGK